MHFAKLGRCQTGDRLKIAAEVAVVTVAAVRDDLTDGQIGLDQLLFGCSKTAGLQVTHHGNACNPLELMGQMGGT